MKFSGGLYNGPQDAMVMRGFLFKDLVKRQLQNLYILTSQRVLLICAHNERVISKRKGGLVARSISSFKRGVINFLAQQQNELII